MKTRAVRSLVLLGALLLSTLSGCSYLTDFFLPTTKNVYGLKSLYRDYMDKAYDLDSKPATVQSLWRKTMDETLKIIQSEPEGDASYEQARLILFLLLHSNEGRLAVPYSEIRLVDADIRSFREEFDISNEPLWFKATAYIILGDAFAAGLDYDNAVLYYRLVLKDEDLDGESYPILYKLDALTATAELVLNSSNPEDEKEKTFQGLYALSLAFADVNATNPEVLFTAAEFSSQSGNSEAACDFVTRAIQTGLHGRLLLQAHFILKTDCDH